MFEGSTQVVRRSASVVSNLVFRADYRGWLAGRFIDHLHGPFGRIRKLLMSGQHWCE
jgi:hypothetical protein